jgi:hypothetical protein
MSSLIPYICSSQKFPSCGGSSVLINKHTSLLSIQCIVVKSCHLSFIVLHFHSSDMPFMFSLTVPQLLIFFVKSSKSSAEAKKLSMYRLCPNPSTYLISSVTVTWRAVNCCAMHCLSFPKYTVMS